jgi:hypothetical protein
MTLYINENFQLKMFIEVRKIGRGKEAKSSCSFIVVNQCKIPLNLQVVSRQLSIVVH